MNKNEEKTKLHDPDVLSADADVQADVDSVMRKYDRESNTRIWEGKPKIAITVILAAFSLWCIYVTLFATFLEEIRLTSLYQKSDAEQSGTDVSDRHYFDGIFDLSV